MSLHIHTHAINKMGISVFDFQSSCLVNYNILIDLIISFDSILKCYLC